MTFIYDLTFKEDNINHFEIVSSDYKTSYSVNILLSECPNQPNCMPQCTEDDCLYLCRHMIACTCYDYQHGHLCKHVHKVKSLQVKHQDIEIIDQPHADDDQHADDSPDQEPFQIGVVPPKANREKAGKVYYSQCIAIYTMMTSHVKYAHLLVT